MATYTIEQITRIIINNPSKSRLDKAREDRKLYLKHVQGVGSTEALQRVDYFEGQEVYNAKKKLALSNKDLFSRLLKEEKQVFTARGGSVRFNLPDEKEKAFNAKLDNVRYGVSLYKWIEKIAYEARKVDPQGVIFVEVEQQNKKPNAYPTYKSVECIHENKPRGRNLDFVCFRIAPNEYETYGIVEADASNSTHVIRSDYKYFRWVDDAQDVILKREGETLTVATNTTQRNPIRNEWGRVPAFVISDLIKFDDPKCFSSPLEEIIELAEKFLDGRADREIQKKLHGFAKAIEPLLKCITCKGTGHINGDTACPDCTPAGHSQGTGWKTHTKVADIVKFPIEILKDVPGFDFKRLFGYATPPIDIWDKQDRSISDIEGLIYYTYWSTANTELSGFNGDNQDETATKTLTNLQPKYAVLNSTADWVEDTANKIANLIGEYEYKGAWRGSNIMYGRNYILETPADLAAAYYEMCKNGAPDNIKDEALERYIRSLYQNNPIQQAKYVKLLKVIPFPHDKAEAIENSQYIPKEDKLMKRFGGEWVDTVTDMYIIAPENTVEILRKNLREYAIKKGALLEPQEVEPQE